MHLSEHIVTQAIDQTYSHALFDYIASASNHRLPDEVAEKGRLHLLDSLAAIISGSTLKPGKLAIRYVRSLGGGRDCTVVGSSSLVPAVSAALANGMMGHADETDDSHLAGHCHPGCAIVPAALAMAEKTGSGGAALLRSVVLGYDVAVRINLALGTDTLDASARSSHSIGPSFGAAAAAGALAGFNARQVGYLMSYTAQQASGVRYWVRDEEHIEKSFDFGGMPARNGVAAASMVIAGFTGLGDPFTGPFNFLTAFSQNAKIEQLVNGIGERFEVMRTTIKKWSVGSPIQAALDSLAALMSANGFNADQVTRLTVRLPDDRAHVVNNREMPDINLQHLLAVMLSDGGLTFAEAHNYDRMNASDVRKIKLRIHLEASKELTRAKPARQAVVEVWLRDGRELSHRTYAVRGTPDNPMTVAEVEAKALDLMVPVLGSRVAEELISTVLTIERVSDVRKLRPLLRSQKLARTYSVVDK